MNHCILSHICQYAQYPNNSILVEKEISRSPKNTMISRKLTTKDQDIHYICNDACLIANCMNYLLDKNGLYESDIFSTITDEEIAVSQKVFNQAVSTCELTTYVTKQNSSKHASDMLTYYSICSMWKGSGVKTMVYNLNFSQYIQYLKFDMNNRPNADELSNAERIKAIIEGRIESSNKNLIIVSGLDFVNFSKYNCEVLFEIIATREAKRLPLIIVAPQLSNIVGEGPLFGKLMDVLNTHRSATT